MKIAVVLDSEDKLSPLDLGEKIDIIDTEEKKIQEFENPGFQKSHGGKEIAMSIILKIKPDVLAIKQGFLCPGSYRMSVNRLKYAITDASNLEELISGLDDIDDRLVDDLSLDFIKE